jgi:glyoxylase-like metal-dependent hydrolase (beta-lactamase superfamily II)
MASESVGLVCHCLLLETEQGLVLVDTGFGTEVIQQRQALIGRSLTRLGRPSFDPKETALAQIESLGYRARDVQHIICTHLDPDHAGGLSDFPDARVHVYGAELTEALAPRWSQRPRYRSGLWAHGPRWQPHEDLGEPWRGFEAVRDLPGLPPDILLVPLLGHSAGHCGVAVDTGDQWLLHCGDAYFHFAELQEPPRCPGVLKASQRLLAIDNSARLENQAKLRALARASAGELQVFCTHDETEFGRCQSDSTV